MIANRSPAVPSISIARRSPYTKVRGSSLKIVLTSESVVNALLLCYVALTPLLVLPFGGLIGTSDLLFFPAVASLLLVGKVRQFSASHILLASFLFLAGVSLYQAREFSYVIKWVRLIGIAFPFFLAGVSTVSLQRILRVFYWSGLFSILVGVVLWWFDITLFAAEANQRLWIEGGESRVRAAGIFGNSGAFGALIAIWTVSCGLFALLQKRPNRLVLATILLTATVSLISSASRVAFVSIVAGIGAGGSLMLAEHLRRRGFRLSGRTLSPIVLSVVVLVATIYFVVPQLMDSDWLSVAYSRFDPRAHSSSNSFLSGRVTIWRHYIDSMDQWGAFGVGYKQGRLNFSASPHNQFLALAAECGLLCLCAFALFVCNIAATAVRRSRDAPIHSMVCLAVLTAFVADGMGGEPLGSWQITPITMILLGTCVRILAQNFTNQPPATRST